MKIAILDDYQDVVRSLDCFSLLKDHEVTVFQNRAVGLGQLAIRLRPFEVLVLNRERTKLPRALLEKLPHLKLIAQTGKVSGHIDLDAARECGISIIEGQGDPTAPAELTWALIMVASRKIPQYSQHLQEGLWQWSSIHPQHNQLGRVLKGRRLGIWGYGRIGQLVARYAQVFGMQVDVWGSAESRAKASADGLNTCATKEEFFKQVDILTLHLRLTPTTRGIVQLSDLQAMKPDALFVNTSRAELVEADALITALDQGHLSAAALDVFETEPLPLDSPLRKHEKVLLTPHLGYVEKDSYELYFGEAFRGILGFGEVRE